MAEGHQATTGAWVAAAVIFAGFCIGGVALIFHTWPWFWVGVGVVVAGLIGAWAVKMMDQVSEYEPPPSG